MKTKKKLGGSGELEGTSSQNEGGSNWIFAILGLLGLGGLAWYFVSAKDKLEPRVRTDQQKASLRASIQEMFTMHGIAANNAKLDEVVNEFLELEKSMNSGEALKKIEQALSKASQKGLVYGNSQGLYGDIPNLIIARS